MTKNGKRVWFHEGPVNRDGRRDCLDFRAYTIAGSKEEAIRNIVWQYKIKFCMAANEDIELDGIVYPVERPLRVAEPKKKKPKVEYDYEQLEMNI